MNSKEDIIDNIKVVCQCKGIKKGRFKQLINEGVLEESELRKATGAGSGSCQGRRCSPRIREMIGQGTLATGADSPG
ncbi:MAG: (2Fe-2S)-binding protein [Nitrospinae bacterium]|nr:(2Fe-2S)-binding protein [Nitrospinota bacterium]